MITQWIVLWQFYYSILILTFSNLYHALYSRQDTWYLVKLFPSEWQILITWSVFLENFLHDLFLIYSETHFLYFVLRCRDSFFSRCPFVFFNFCTVLSNFHKITHFNFVFFYIFFLLSISPEGILQRSSHAINMNIIYLDEQNSIYST